MQEKAKVTAIHKDIITVMPIDIEVCIGCKNNDCKQNGSQFFAKNTKSFSLEIGTEVRLKASAKAQYFQGLFALGIPLFFAFGGYYFRSFFFSKTTEIQSILFALLGLLIGSILALILRRYIKAELPEIYKIVEK